MILVITEVPVSTTVPLDSSVNFTCVGIGHTLIWLLQSSGVTESVKKERGISLTDTSIGNNLSSVLTITALPINSDIGLGCQIISLNPFQQVYSNTAILMIKG